MFHLGFDYARLQTYYGMQTLQRLNRSILKVWLILTSSSQVWLPI